jgi:hypothetical protein
VFRRIDGAAERVEIDFASLAQSMQFLPQIEAWPEVEINASDKQRSVPAAGETLQENAAPPTAVPSGGVPSRS